MKADDKTVIIRSDALTDGGKGVRFALPVLGLNVTGFAVRYNGLAYAYVNQCAHVSVELDWEPGEFFTAQKDFLVCATHGACYRPDNGFCVAGPCKGRSLKPIPLIEQNGEIIINIASISA